MAIAPIQRPPGREIFFATVHMRSNPRDTERVKFSYEAAKAGHAKQFRRDGVTRYFDHPKRAAWIYLDELGGMDMDVAINILLHDIGEDSYLLSFYRMKLNFGKRCALDHFALTKLAKGKETVVEYLNRIMHRGPRAIVAKLCDRLDNIRDIGSCTREQIEKIITETEEYHTPLLIKELKKYGGEWNRMADLLSQKIADALLVAKERLQDESW